VESDPKTLKYVSDSHLGRPRMAPLARLVWALAWDARWRLEVGSLLPPSSGPTQAGATPRVTFRAAIKAGGDVDMVISL
jgi:hypothetical protein